MTKLFKPFGINTEEDYEDDECEEEECEEDEWEEVPLSLGQVEFLQNALNQLNRVGEDGTVITEKGSSYLTTLWKFFALPWLLLVDVLLFPLASYDYRRRSDLIDAVAANVTWLILLGFLVRFLIRHVV